MNTTGSSKNAWPLTKGQGERADDGDTGATDQGQPPAMSVGKPAQRHDQHGFAEAEHGDQAGGAGRFPPDRFDCMAAKSGYRGLPVA